MRCSALGYNIYVNPFSSRAVDVFHHFAYIILATVMLDILRVETHYWYICMATEHH